MTEKSGLPDYLKERFRRATQGDAGEQQNLAVHFYAIEKNYEEAVRWWSLAAEQGHAIAQYSLGNAYNEGKGFEPDYEQAAHWWRLAAEQGYTEAQYSLGYAYDTGKGLEQHYEQAAYWTRQA